MRRLTFLILLTLMVLFGGAWIIWLPNTPRYAGLFRPVVGVVVDQNGHPVAHVDVVATLQVSTFGLFGGGCPYSHVLQTDDQGRFFLPVAAPYVRLPSVIASDVINDAQADWLLGVFAPPRFQLDSPYRLGLIRDRWENLDPSSPNLKLQAAVTEKDMAEGFRSTYTTLWYPQECVGGQQVYSLFKAAADAAVDMMCRMPPAQVLAPETVVAYKPYLWGKSKRPPTGKVNLAQSYIGLRITAGDMCAEGHGQ